MLTFCITINAKSQTSPYANRVIDEAEIFSLADKIRLNEMIAKYERETTHQFGVMTIKSLSGENIAAFSLRQAKSSRLGRKGINNGLLIIIAPNERVMRIELGTGIEKYISNSRAKEIIDFQMAPSFRHGEFSKGTELALIELMKDGRAFVIR